MSKKTIFLMHAQLCLFLPQLSHRRDLTAIYHLCCRFCRSKGLPMQLPLLGHNHVSLPRQRIKNNFLSLLAGIYLLTYLLLFLSPIKRSANSIQGDGLLFSCTHSNKIYRFLTAKLLSQKKWEDNMGTFTSTRAAHRAYSWQ